MVSWARALGLLRASSTFFTCNLPFKIPTSMHACVWVLLRPALSWHSSGITPQALPRLLLEAWSMLVWPCVVQGICFNGVERNFLGFPEDFK